MTVDNDARFGLVRRFIQLSILFSISGILLYFIEIGVDKQYVKPLQSYNSIWLFVNIAGKNSLVFLALLSSVYSGQHIKNIIAYLFALVNGGAVGALIAHFPTIEYCVLLSPHGFLEMSSYFLLLGAVATTHQEVRGKLPRRLLLLSGVSYAMLLGAAWIEAFITPFLAVSYLL